MEKNKNNRLVIIVKIEKYIEYMLTILLKLPRIEKFRCVFSTNKEEKMSYVIIRNTKYKRENLKGIFRHKFKKQK